MASPVCAPLLGLGHELVSVSALSTCLNAMYSHQLCQLCVSPPLNEAVPGHRMHLIAKTRYRAGFWHCLSSVMPFLWEQQPVSASGSACSIEEAQLRCVMGRAHAHYEEGAPLCRSTCLPTAGSLENTVLLSPGHCCPQLWVAEWQQ